MDMRNLLSFWIIILSGSLSAQEVVSYRITSQNGLPSNNTTCVFEDSRHILWIGTQQGLAVLQDGETSQVFQENGAPILNAWTIVEDEENRIWVGTYGHGLFMFNGKVWKQYSSTEGLSTNQIRVLKIFNNKLWIGTSESLAVLDFSEKDYPIQIETESRNAGIITSFLEINDSLYYTNLNGEIRNAFSGNLLFKSGIGGLLGLYRFSEEFWLIHKGYYHVLTEAEFFNGVLKDSLELNTRIWDLVEINQTVLGAGWGEYEKSGGIFKMGLNGKEFFNPKFGLEQKDFISLCYSDRNKILYLASKTEGVIAVPVNSPINLIRSSMNEDNTCVGITNLNKQPLYLQRNGISCTINGITKNLSKSDFKKFQVKKNATRNKPLPKRKDGFFELDYTKGADEVEFYRIRKSQNEFWVSTNIGMFVLDNELHFMDYLPVHALVFGLNDRGNLVEAIPHNGVRLYHNKNEREAKAYLKPDPKCPKSVTDIVTVGKYTFFASVFYGITVFDGEEMYSLLESGVFKEKSIRTLKVWGDDKLVVSTDFGEIFILNSHPPFHVLDSISSELLYGNNIQFVEVYDSTLIVGMLDGINFVNKNGISFLSNGNGLPRDIITTAHVIDSNLMVGSKSSVFSINLKQFPNKANRISSVVISEVWVNNKPVFNNEKSWFGINKNHLDLPFNENTIKLKFHVKGVKFPKLLQFRYRLNERDQWSGYFEEPEILLPFLDNGNFQLQIQVKDANSGKRNVFKVLNLIIRPPFYKTWWFNLFVTAFVGLTTVLIIKKRENFIRNHEQQKARLQHELDESRMQSLLSQMNPHFIFNAINSIQSFILKQETRSAVKYLNLFSGLMRDTLKNSESNTLILSKEINYLQNYISLENVRTGNKVNCIWELDENLDVEGIKIPSMVIQPFIENVFEHAFPARSKECKLKITMTEESTSLVVVISDNGIGFNPSVTTIEPHGMEITRKRMAIVNSNFKDGVVVNSVVGSGTTVTLQFPLI